MRHRMAGNRLGRNSDLRKATLRDVAKATLIHQRICTTKGMAKEARRLVDQLITLGKKGTLAHRRKAFSILCDHALVSELFGKISGRFKNRIGGYTRVIPLSMRRGDNAQLAYLELTEKEVVIVNKPKSTAAAKPKEKITSTAPTDVKKGEGTVIKPEVPEVKKEKLPKPEPVKTYPKDLPTKEKPKTTKPFFGGIKKIFTKKPSGG